MSGVELRPFVAGDLPLVEPWFDDPETRRRLGGRDWPRGLVALVATPPPGTRHTTSVAFVDGGAVALVDVEIDQAGEVSFALAVAPDQRRRGIARAVVHAVADEPSTRDRTIVAGVNQDNVASMRLLEACDFVRAGDPDADGFVYYRRGPRR
jgi:ribosomal protein S18 acetylase RimI-like enzyme